jgi:hypothetical protein
MINGTFEFEKKREVRIIFIYLVGWRPKNQPRNGDILGREID